MNDEVIDDLQKAMMAGTITGRDNTPHLSGIPLRIESLEQDLRCFYLEGHLYNRNQTIKWLKFRKNKNVLIGQIKTKRANIYSSKEYLDLWRVTPKISAYGTIEEYNKLCKNY